MKRPIKVFEPITNEQIKKLHSMNRDTGVSPTRLYGKVVELTGLPSITALSKQEAKFLIDHFQGKGWRRYPPLPKYENEIKGDTSELASFYHIRDIRQMFVALGWSKEQIKGWLMKYRKVKDLRSLDRKQAQATYIILGKMVEALNNKKAEQKKEVQDDSSVFPQGTKTP